MATLTRQQLKNTGIAPTYAAVATGGDEVANNGRTFLQFKNTHATLTGTVTVNSRKNCSQDSDHDLVVIVAAVSGDQMIGPLPTDRFNDANGRVTWTYTGETSLLKVGAFDLPS